MLAAALEYTQRLGWHVFPVHSAANGRCTCKDGAECDSPGKHPRVAKWESVATTNPAAVREMFTRWPSANLGWALGRDECAAVDVDPRNGGFDSFAVLERECGSLDTKRQNTGGGGVHHIVHVPSGTVLQSRNNAFGDSYPGIDLNSGGGFFIVLAAPSIHYSGESLRMWDGSSPAQLAELPIAWVNAIQTSRSAFNGTRFEIPQKIRDGERHRILHKLASSLRDKGATGTEILAMLCEVNAGRCEPPFSDRKLQNLARDTEQRYEPHHSIFEQSCKEKSTVTWTVETVAEIAKRGVAPALWDIQDLLPHEEGPAILFGAPGALKTWIALHAAACSQTGERFLGHFPVRRRPAAVYINFDAGKRAFERRALRLGVPGLRIVSPDCYDPAAMREVFAAYPEAFVVIDTFSDIYQLKRGDDIAESMRNFFRRELRGLYEEYGSNGFILDHPHRPRDGEPHGDYYGSVQ